MTAGWFTFASDVVDIPAALLALILVRRVTSLQEIVIQSDIRTTELGTGA